MCNNVKPTMRMAVETVAARSTLIKMPFKFKYSMWIFISNTKKIFMYPTSKITLNLFDLLSMVIMPILIQV